jgi:hypothetical protein
VDFFEADLAATFDLGVEFELYSCVCATTLTSFFSTSGEYKSSIDCLILFPAFEKSSEIAIPAIMQATGARVSMSRIITQLKYVANTP